MRADAPRLRDTRWGATLRSAPVTFALAAADIAVFAWVALHGPTTDTATLIRFGALEPARVWSGEWWRLLTAAFLHVGVLHLTWNLFLGVPLCRLVEGALGARRFLALYLLATLGASAASLLGHQAAVSAGASGALFGVAGAMFALFRRLVGSWGAFFRARQIRLNALLFGVFALAAVWLPIDQLAHAGGLVTGAIFAWLLTRPPPRRAFPWVVFAAALGAAVALAVRPDPRFTANREFDLSELSFAKFTTQVSRDDADIIGLTGYVVHKQRLFELAAEGKELSDEQNIRLQELMFLLIDPE